MKTLNSTLTLLAAILLLTTCKKSTVSIDDTNLTACQPNTTCTYLYKNYADIKDQAIVNGNYLVFEAMFKNGIYISTGYAFKIAQRSGQFVISDNDIKNGSVKYVFSCPVCSSISDYLPGGGYVKGVKTGNRWLIDAQIIMSSKSVPNARDTVKIKQYFEQGLQTGSMYY